MTSLLLLVLLILLLGASLGRVLGVPRELGRLVAVGWSWMLGAFAAAVVALVWAAAGFVGAPPWVLLGTLALVGVVLGLSGRRASRPLVAPPPSRAPGWERALFVLALLVGLLQVSTEILRIAGEPLLSEDETLFWALKAKLIHTAGGLGESYHALAAGATKRINLDYPPLNPLLQLLVFEVRGDVTHAANRLPIQLFVPALLVSLAGAVAHLTRPLFAAILVTCVANSTVLGTVAGRAMSDLVVAGAVLGLLHAALLARHDARWLRLVCVFAALAVFAKHDARLILASTALAWVVSVAVERVRVRRSDAAPRPILGSDPMRRLLPWLAVPAVTLLVIEGLNAAAGARNNFNAARGDDSGLAGRILTQAPEEAPEVLRFLFERVVLTPTYAGLVPVAFLLLVFLAPRVCLAGELRSATLALFLTVGGIALVFCGLPHDTGWHLATAADRVVFQVVPAMALFVAVAADRALADGAGRVPAE